MNRLTLIAFSSLAVLGILSGCASSTNSSYNQTSVIQTNENDTTSSNGTDSSAPSNGFNSMATNNTGFTISPQRDGLQFSNYVVQAMDQVKRATKMPFIFAPTEPTFQPSAPFVGVKEYASDWNYNVSLFSATTSIPLNDPSLNKLPESSFICMFGGTYYSSHDQAMNKLNTEFHVTKVQNTGTIDGFMKQYTTGKIYNPGTNMAFPQHVIEWREGKWTIDVFGAPSFDFNNEAKQVNTFLRYHALPPTDGRILINPNVTGDQVTKIGWVFGNTLYECESPSMTMDQIFNALQMAASMREYDSYRVTP